VTDLATLITAIAALITATGGATAAVLMAWRTTGRQRYRAAEEAERLTNRPPRRGRHALRDDDGWDDGDAADEP
jgi:hypothetical protein